MSIVLEKNKEISVTEITKAINMFKLIGVENVQQAERYIEEIEFEESAEILELIKTDGYYKLPPIDRKILLLRFYSKLSFEEIGNMTRKAASRVELKINDSIKKLRKLKKLEETNQV